MKTLILLLLISSAVAEDIKTNDGKEYKDVTVTGADPDALRIMYSNGAGRILFENLPKEIQKKYNYDPVKAKEFDKKEQEKAALSDQAYADHIAKSKPLAMPTAQENLIEQLNKAKANLAAVEKKNREFVGFKSGASRQDAQESNKQWKELQDQLHAWTGEVARLQKLTGTK